MFIKGQIVQQIERFHYCLHAHKRLSFQRFVFIKGVISMFTNNLGTLAKQRKIVLMYQIEINLYNFEY